MISKKLQMRNKYECVICGLKTSVKTGKTQVGWDGTDPREFYICGNPRCNCQYTLCKTIK